MALATLQAIRSKVRNITRSPSVNQLSDAKLDDYINTFILYDFPENIRLFNLRSVFTFYTQPFVDQYQSSTNPNDALYDFKNRVEAVHEPMFLAGIQSLYTQKRDVFYGYYPQTNNVSFTTAIGNGTPGPFTFTLSAFPVLQNNVTFSCPDDTPSHASMTLIDYPIDNATGNLGLPNSTVPASGVINYTTGQVTGLIFPGNTQTGVPITSSTIPYQPGKPTTMLYYDNIFTLRPVPDKVYTVQFEVDLRPTELLVGTDVPQLEQWWQYIAVQTCIKIFEDRFDFDSIQKLMPTVMEYESKVLRNTITQQANERTLTIYTQGKGWPGFGFFGGAGWPY